MVVPASLSTWELYVFGVRLPIIINSKMKQRASNYAVGRCKYYRECMSAGEYIGRNNTDPKYLMLLKMTPKMKRSALNIERVLAKSTLRVHSQIQTQE